MSSGEGDVVQEAERTALSGEGEAELVGTEPGTGPEQKADEVVEEIELGEEPDDGVPRVLVTGASGYIASALTETLLQDGRFRIRGTVRSKKKKEKVLIELEHLAMGVVLCNGGRYPPNPAWQ